MSAIASALDGPMSEAAGADEPLLSWGDRSLIRLVAAMVGTVLGLEPMGVLAGRKPETARARQVAMYLACTGLDWTTRRVGEAFERDKSTVAYACARVEERREDPLFDQAMQTLERWVGALADAARRS